MDIIKDDSLDVQQNNPLYEYNTPIGAGEKAETKDAVKEHKKERGK